MPGNPSLRELLEVQNYFNLPSPALVEKDWYVVRALAAVTSLRTNGLQLVFGGGTALSRAHRLTQRMSEDIDLKIVAIQEPTRKELRALREQVTQSLILAGFDFDPGDKRHCDSRNESRYTVFQLPYAPLTEGSGILRPEIKIEIALGPLKRTAVVCNVRSFVEEAFDRPAEAPAVPCTSVTENVAEKFVALTRRLGAELSNAGSSRDKTLVRHIYDIHQTRGHYDLDDVLLLVREIIPDDVKAYGNRFPAYRENPILETI